MPTVEVEITFTVSARQKREIEAMIYQYNGETTTVAQMLGRKLQDPFRRVFTNWLTGRGKVGN